MKTFFFEAIKSNPDSTMLSPRKTQSVGINTHFHRQMEILIVHEGVCTATINGEKYTLNAHDIAISEPYDLHSWGNEVGRYTCIIIPYSKLNRYNEFRAGRVLKNKVSHDIDFYKKVVKIVDTLYEYYDTTINDDGYIIDCLMKAIVGIIIDNLPFGDKNSRREGDFIQKILSYIDNNYKSDMSLDTISKAFGFSTYHFSKLFNRHVGMHLNAYINMVRTQNVLHLVRDKKVAITDAILDSGFSSITPFYRYFKNTYGTSIKEYLKK